MDDLAQALVVALVTAIITVGIMVEVDESKVNSDCTLYGHHATVKYMMTCEPRHEIK